MSGDRPAYGEYATPEEQRRRMEANAPAAPQMPEPTAPPAERPTTEDASGSILPKVTSARRVDRLIGTLLLVWGLFSVIQTVPQLTNLGAYLHDSFKMLGVDAELSDPSSLKRWGIAAAFVYAGGWLLTAVLTWLRAKQGRILFWIPLVGAVVFTIVIGVLISIPLANDPALIDSLSGQLPTAP